MIHLEGFCDDSNGEVGEVIGAVQENLTNIVVAAALNAADSNKLMDMLLKHAVDSICAERVIEEALAKSRLERALKLCLDGEAMDHEYAGLVKN